MAGLNIPSSWGSKNFSSIERCSSHWRDMGSSSHWKYPKIGQIQLSPQNSPKTPSPPWSPVDLSENVVSKVKSWSFQIWGMNISYPRWPQDSSNCSAWPSALARCKATEASTKASPYWNPHGAAVGVTKIGKKWDDVNVYLVPCLGSLLFAQNILYMHMCTQHSSWGL
jgi:hypothetical protein